MVHTLVISGAWWSIPWCIVENSLVHGGVFPGGAPWCLVHGRCIGNPGEAQEAPGRRLPGPGAPGLPGK